MCSARRLRHQEVKLEGQISTHLGLHLRLTEMTHTLAVLSCRVHGEALKPSQRDVQ